MNVSPVIKQSYKVNKFSIRETLHFGKSWNAGLSKFHFQYVFHHILDTSRANYVLEALDKEQGLQKTPPQS